MTAGSPAKPDPIAQLGAGDLAGEWALDAVRSQARFATRSLFGAVPVKGAFTALSGHATVSGRGEASGRLTIGTASLDTGNARRDTHLKSASFLDAANHPAIEFALGPGFRSCPGQRDPVPACFPWPGRLVLVTRASC